jgi:hypothetical protein
MRKYMNRSLRVLSQERTKPESLPNGIAAATVLAAGIGCAVFGILTFLSEAMVAVKALMVLDTDVGALSGKAIYTVVAWLAVWGLLGLKWRGKEVNFSRVAMVFLWLLVISLLATFPPIWLH